MTKELSMLEKIDSFFGIFVGYLEATLFYDIQGFPIIIIVLLIGSYKYYERQSIEHADNWSWMTFWFGSHNKCQ